MANPITQLTPMPRNLPPLRPSFGYTLGQAAAQAIPKLGTDLVNEGVQYGVNKSLAQQEEDARLNQARQQADWNTQENARQAQRGLVTDAFKDTQAQQDAMYTTAAKARSLAASNPTLTPLPSGNLSGGPSYAGDPTARPATDMGTVGAAPSLAPPTQSAVPKSSPFSGAVPSLPDVAGKTTTVPGQGVLAGVTDTGTGATPPLSPMVLGVQKGLTDAAAGAASAMGTGVAPPVLTPKPAPVSAPTPAPPTLGGIPQSAVTGALSQVQKPGAPVGRVAVRGPLANPIVDSMANSAANVMALGANKVAPASADAFTAMAGRSLATATSGDQENARAEQIRQQLAASLNLHPLELPDPPQMGSTVEDSLRNYQTWTRKVLSDPAYQTAAQLSGAYEMARERAKSLMTEANEAMKAAGTGARPFSAAERAASNFGTHVVVTLGGLAVAEAKQANKGGRPFDDKEVAKNIDSMDAKAQQFAGVVKAIEDEAYKDSGDDPAKYRELLAANSAYKPAKETVEAVTAEKAKAQAEYQKHMGFAYTGGLTPGQVAGQVATQKQLHPLPPRPAPATDPVREERNAFNALNATYRSRDIMGQPIASPTTPAAMQRWRAAKAALEATRQ